ncbi:MAG: MATE family efflux transporter [Gammaproteobacteria bacterium]|nr:MATE family efflux transporter [Gammaproteobacteria bacterium]
MTNRGRKPGSESHFRRSSCEVLTTVPGNATLTPVLSPPEPVAVRWRDIDHSATWRLAWPLIVSNVAVAVLGLVDTGVIGHLGLASYLGGVAIASVILDFLYWGLGFLRMGTTGIVAQLHGNADHDRLRSALAQALGLALGLGTLMLIFQTPLATLGLALLDGSAEVHGHARRYFDVAIWGAPAMLSVLVLVGWFIGMQNPRGPLVVMLTMNVVNVVLDFVFVFGLGYDIVGVAAASVIAQYSAFVLGLGLAIRMLARYPGRWRRTLVLDPGAWRRMLGLNRDILVRTVALLGTFAFFTSQGARLGDIVLAANAVLLKFLMLTSLGLDGFAHAAEALAGRAIGRGDRLAFRRAVAGASVWAALTAAVYVVFYAWCGNAVIALLTDLAAVRAAAAEYLPWIIAAPLLCVWCYLLDGVYVGATRGREMRNTMLIAVLLVFLPAWWLLRPFANHGLWLALMLFFVARGAGLGWLYRRIEARSGFVAVPAAAPA